jgi:hypothetical protein
VNLDLDTAGYPVTERFPVWREVMSQLLAPVELSSEHAADFRASASVSTLGAVHLSAVRTSSLELRRTPRMIRQSDPEAYQVALTLHGHGGVEQSRQHASLGRHDLAIYDTSRPFLGWASSPGRLAEGMMLAVPRSLLPLPENSV